MELLALERGRCLREKVGLFPVTISVHLLSDPISRGEEGSWGGEEEGGMREGGQESGGEGGR